MMREITVLIIGAGGFVGPYLERELVANGYKVFGCGIHSEGCSYVGELLQVDVTKYEEILKVIIESKPDIIYNLAAVSSVGLSWEQPQQTVNVNVIGTINIMEAIKDTAVHSKLILIGSSEEYAPSSSPVAERDRLEAVNPYGITRISIELFAKMYKERYGLDIVCIRAFNHTGPGQTSTFVLPSFIEQAARITASGKSGEIMVGNMGVYRDFSDVRDIVRAYRLIAECGEKIDVINVGSGKAYYLQELLEYIVSLSDQEIMITVDPARFRPADLPYCCCDNTKLKEKTGWMPDREIHGTLREMYELAIRKRG